MSTIQEHKFNEFVQKLLGAQANAYDFLEDHRLFSHDTLTTILEQFCEIIADDLDVESCTVHLKLYNHRLMVKENLKDSVKKKLEKLAEKHGYKAPEPETATEKKNKIAETKWRVFEKHREEHWTSPLTFPYWMHSKGASKLIASNPGGPWFTVLKQSIKDGKSTGIASLKGGISKQIYQEKMPKERDPLGIRRARNFRKIGGADKKVWKNTTWKEVFRNYYGVPIRIHSGGEVIGILKVENKKDKYENFLSEMGGPVTKEKVRALEDKILEEIRIARQERPIEQLPISLLSLAYLIHDLQQPECLKKKVPDDGKERDMEMEELVFIPYPANTEKNPLVRAQNETLRPEDDNRPPVQLFTESIADERWLWTILCDDDDISKIYDEVKCFYCRLNKLTKDLPNIEEAASLIKKEIESAKGIEKKGLQATVVPWYDDTRYDDTLPDFFFKITLETKEKEPEKKTIYLFIPPKSTEWSAIEVFSDDKKTNYGRINEPGEDQPLGDNIAHVGEFYEYDNTSSKNRERVTNLLLDRLAARTQALVFSLPLPGFEESDSHKLSWAAFEIGKLIEREISYHANRSDDAIPLTAMEFHRIPISDLSFVDDLRKRRTSLSSVQENFDYHVKYLIRDMKMMESIRYASRIKSYRSALLRFGERHEAYVRGNIAIWVYLLSLLFEDQGGRPYKEEKVGNKNKQDGCKKTLDDIRDKLDENIDSYSVRVEKDNVYFTEQESETEAVFETIEDKAYLIHRLKRIRDGIYRKMKVETEEEQLKTQFHKYLVIESHLLNILTNGFPHLKHEGKDAPSPDDIRLEKERLDRRRKELETLITKLTEVRDLKETVPTSFEEVEIEIKDIRDEVHKQLSNLEEHTEFGKLWDQYSFVLNLLEFRERVDTLVRTKIGSQDNPVDPQEYKAFFAGQCKSGLKDDKRIIGDVSFNAPPIQIPAKEKIPQAIERVRNNLSKEGWITLAGADTEDADQIHGIARHGLSDLLLRNYDEFARASFSLLCQLINRDRFDNDHARFYAFCYKLRGLLCTSSREIEDDPGNWILRSVFREEDSKKNVWRKIIQFISTYTSSEFRKLYNIPDAASSTDDELFLSRRSIYKRIRTLNHTLHHQRSAASLEWELRRFDLCGSRINCLHKNQVFALSEYVWSRGDPFFYNDQSKTKTQEFDGFYDRSTSEYSRLRWLCMRERVHQGKEYNAIQIVALVDPKTTQRGYWARQGYNLKWVQRMLGALYEEIDPQSAERYKYFSFYRNGIRADYGKWHEAAQSVLKHEKPANEKATWFGSFLFKGVLDVLLMILVNRSDGVRWTDSLPDEAFRCLVRVVESLGYIICTGIEYTGDIMPRFSDESLIDNEGYKEKTYSLFMKPYDDYLKYLKTIKASPYLDKAGFDDVCKWSKPINPSYEHLNPADLTFEGVYAETEALLDSLLPHFKSHEQNSKIVKTLKEDCRREKEYYRDILDCYKTGRDDCELHIPLFYIDDKKKWIERVQSLLTTHQQLLEGPNYHEQVDQSHYNALTRFLTRLRREQKSYLFYNRINDDAWSGLWMRNQDEVMARVQNYILLFDPEDPLGEKFRDDHDQGPSDDDNKEKYYGWTAYDLYYYIRGLIPIELQIRTELSNTLAEQYHDAVYKGHPPLHTVFPRAMMAEMGIRLDDIDFEMGIDLEGYIWRYARGVDFSDHH